MKQNMKYLKHWFGYCYYRSVNLYSSLNEEPEYFFGSMPFIVLALPIYAILRKHGLYLLHSMTDAYLAIVVSGVILLICFSENKYYKMKLIFEAEDKKTSRVLGYFVIATFAIPAVASLVYMVC